MAAKTTKEKREGWPRDLNFTESTSAKMLVQNGTEVEYFDAVDPPEAGRTYREGRARPAMG